MICALRRVNAARHKDQVISNSPNPNGGNTLALLRVPSGCMHAAFQRLFGDRPAPTSNQAPLPKSYIHPASMRFYSYPLRTHKLGSVHRNSGLEYAMHPFCFQVYGPERCSMREGQTIKSTELRISFCFEPHQTSRRARSSDISSSELVS